MQVIWRIRARLKNVVNRLVKNRNGAGDTGNGEGLASKDREYESRHERGKKDLGDTVLISGFY